MSIPVCGVCHAELGPWEGAECLYHNRDSARSIADQAIVVLEQAPVPLYLHDLQRGIEREVGRRTDWGSVSSVVGSDRRFCWSGKGMYALFRHCRVPGVRTLAESAAFLLVAASEPLSADEIGLVLSWSGYRFQQTSLEAALAREARFAMGWRPETAFSTAGWKAALADPDDERKRLDEMRLPLTEDFEVVISRLLGEDTPPTPTWPVDELVEKWSSRVREGLIERLTRIARVRGARRRDADNS